jgi:hypothetical protein
MMDQMEQIFSNLTKIQTLINKGPHEFQVTDSNRIFELLESNDYETVINKIRKNIVPSDDEESDLSYVQVPDSPANGLHASPSNNSSFNISLVPDEIVTNGVHRGKGSNHNNQRKRKRSSNSDINVSPARPPNPAEAAGMEPSSPVLRPRTDARDQTETDMILSNLLDIFSDKKPVYLKNKINLNPGLQVDQLVALILSEDEHPANNTGMNGHELHQNSLIHEVLVVSDDEEFIPRAALNTSTPRAIKTISHRQSLNTTSSLSINDSANGSSATTNGSGNVSENRPGSSQLATTNGADRWPDDLLTGGVEPLPDIPVNPQLTDVANVTIDLDHLEGAAPGNPENGEANPHADQHPQQPVAGPSNSQQNGDKDNNLNTLLSFFPHVDPSYLEKTAQEIKGCQTKLQEFITNNIGSPSLPNRKEYDAKMAKKSAIDIVKNMTVPDFLREFDNPEQSFNDITSTVSDAYKKNCVTYLTAKFSYLPKRTMPKVLKENNHRLLPCVKKLNNIKSTKRKNAKPQDCHLTMETLDLGFFKDYIYMKLEPRIQEVVRQNEDVKQQRIEQARADGALFECQCCFDEESLLIEVCMCTAGHMFCPDCVRRGAEVGIGDNKTRINCMQDCTAEIEPRVLERVLKPSIFQRLAERLANEELMNANLENLVQCPACNFAVIIPESEKLIECKNPGCGKVSCKECKEQNHLPLRCDEVEKDDEVKARTKLENAMALAMIRECPKCKNRFIKQDGCNKMICSKCKTIMCYLCKQAITNGYQHFYGHGASPSNKCPLFSDNDKLHKAEVAKAADETKKELGENTLKHDPTVGMERPPEGFDAMRLPGQPAVAAGRHRHHALLARANMDMAALHAQMEMMRQRMRIPQLVGHPVRIPAMAPLRIPAVAPVLVPGQFHVHPGHHVNVNPGHQVQINHGHQVQVNPGHHGVPMQHNFQPLHPGNFAPQHPGMPYGAVGDPANGGGGAPGRGRGGAGAFHRMLDQHMGQHRVMDFLRQDIEALMHYHPAGHGPGGRGHRRHR